MFSGIKFPLRHPTTLKWRYFFSKYLLKILKKSEERTSHMTYLHLRIELELTKWVVKDHVIAMNFFVWCVVCQISPSTVKKSQMTITALFSVHSRIRNSVTLNTNLVISIGKQILIVHHIIFIPTLYRWSKEPHLFKSISL